MEGQSDEKPPCHDERHEWKEVYYGTECVRCGVFYPHGCEPWADYEDPTETED